MVKTVTSVGDEQGIVLDPALLELANLKVGDQVSVTVQEGGAIVLTPVRAVLEPQAAQETARRLIQKNAELFRRLA
jgi:antitoxin component of MazEF toxin-antitoxin module